MGRLAPDTSYRTRQSELIAGAAKRPWFLAVGARNKIEIWTPDATLPTAEHEHVIWYPNGASARLTIELQELFRPG